MKLSISNIAWKNADDLFMYETLQNLGFQGIEIAPTRIFPENPYDCLSEANSFALDLKIKYNLNISSMQSIWFGRTEGIFESEASRKILLDYTKKAILFASDMNCPNLVFGCPRNRNTQNTEQLPIAKEFFKELGDFAYENNTVLALEPNPVIYNTNFINTTSQAFDFVKDVDSKGFLVNIDLGTIIYNEESLDKIDFKFVNHIHISEPNMVKIEKRHLHNQLFEMLKTQGYKKYVSIEMKTQEDIKDVLETLDYVKGIDHEY